MKRLFVAIDLPEAIKTQLKALCRDLDGARWVAHHQMHLTLRFIGDADEAQLAKIQAGLATIQAAPFKMMLQAVGQFPEKGKPRVIWVGITAEAELNELQQKIEQVISSTGFEKADHPFSPHITLARFKNPPTSESIEHYFAQHQVFKSDRFGVEQFILYSSQLATNGSIYQQERNFALA